MSSLLRGFRAPVVVLSLSALLGACIHDWVQWEPGGTAGNGGTGLGSGSTSGTGAGPQGDCPAATAGPALVRVVTPAGVVCMDRTEVTKGDYQDWLDNGKEPDDLPIVCNADGRIPGGPWPPNGIGLLTPVSYVDWCDAVAYCLANGKRLCGRLGGGNVLPAQRTNALVDEWFAACSDGGKQVYPYGKSYAPTTCNGADAAGDEAVFVGTLPGCVTPDGVADLSGNVWEWEDSCVGDSSMDDGCAVRGGGFNNDAANLTCATADPRPRGAQAVNIGFRCCAPVLPEDS